MKLKMLALGAALVLAIPAAHAQKVLKYAHFQPAKDDQPKHVAALAFKEHVEKATNGSIKVEIYPAGQFGKDQQTMEGLKLGTLELAVALTEPGSGPESDPGPGPEPRIVVVGGQGNRADHELANLLAPTAPGLANRAVTAWHGDALVTVIRPGRATVLHGPPDSVLSLLPMGGAVQAVQTHGLRFPLHHEDLPSGTSRGVSNVMVSTAATVELASGVLVAVQPYALPAALAELPERHLLPADTHAEPDPAEDPS